MSVAQSSSTPTLGNAGNISGNSGVQPAKQPTAGDVLDILNQEDETPPNQPIDQGGKGKDKDKTPTDDEIRLRETPDDDDRIDLDEEEEETNKDEDKDKDKDKNKRKTQSESEDEDLDLDAPPKKKDLQKEYPDIFKKFPWFEKMIYRDRQYTELFGSFDDAKEVAEKAQILDTFEQDLMKGNTETILKQIKQNDPKAFDKIVDNYLVALSKVDSEAYVEVCGNVGKHIIKELVTEANSVRSTNKDQADLLQNAALILNQYLFGSSNYIPPKPRVEAKSDEAEEKLNERERNFTRQRYEAARDDLQTRVDNTLRATISDYIDRNNEMSPYVKKNAVNDAMRLLHQTIGNDGAFRKNLDKLWEGAFGQGFNQNSLNAIKSAYLGRSKQLLKAIIQKARAEALKDAAPVNRQQQAEEEEERPTSSIRRGPITSGRPRQSSGKNERRAGESVSEFFMRD